MQLFLKSLDQREHSKAKVSGRIFTFLAAEKLAYQTLMNAINVLVEEARVRFLVPSTV